MAEDKVKLGVALEGGGVVRETTVKRDDDDPATWGVDARLAVVFGRGLLRG